MAIAAKKDLNDKQKALRIIEKMEEEFRWCQDHPFDVSINEIEQLKDGIDELDRKFKAIGGKFYEHFLSFRKKFDYLATHIKKLKTSDYHKFHEMIESFFKDLK